MAHFSSVATHRYEAVHFDAEGVRALVGPSRVP
jgi:hypothetical protein